MHRDSGDILDGKRRELAERLSKIGHDTSIACITTQEGLFELEKRLKEQDEYTKPVIRFGPDGKTPTLQSQRPPLQTEYLPKDPVREEKYKNKQKKDVLKREIKELESALGKINLSIDARTRDGSEAQLKNLEDSRNNIKNELAQKSKELDEREQRYGSDDWYVC